MRKTIVTLVSAVLIAGFAGSAQATPMTFNIDLAASSVDIFYNGREQASSLDVTEVLADGNFTVADTGTPYAIDFFTMIITSKSFGWADYGIRATLAFDLPPIGPVVGEGSVSFELTFGGIVSGGVLTWDSGVPASFLVGGNEIVVDFEDGIAGIGNATTVHALITNNGGATPVPEPNTLLLLGAGLVGLAVSSRRKSRKS